MNNTRLSFLLFMSLIALLLPLTSCNKLCGMKNAPGSRLNITDIRTGTGENDISVGTIVFNADEKIIISFDIQGFTPLSQVGPNGTKTNYYYLRQDLIMRDKDGGILALKPSVITQKEPLYSKPLKFKNSIRLSEIANLKPGKYTVTLLATDLTSFQTATETVPVIIK